MHVILSLHMHCRRSSLFLQSSSRNSDNMIWDNFLPPTFLGRWFGERRWYVSTTVRSNLPRSKVLCGLVKEIHPYCENLQHNITWQPLFVQWALDRHLTNGCSKSCTGSFQLLDLEGPLNEAMGVKKFYKLHGWLYPLDWTRNRLIWLAFASNKDCHFKFQYWRGDAKVKIINLINVDVSTCELTI